ncbi:MAG: hypothetical protein H6969_12015 [Gammaproteobacteria bacterium]|nr:hypothetical protein [Gammaproteobacteria bacterium]
MNIKRFAQSWRLCGSLLFGLLLSLSLPQARATTDISNLPLFLGGNGTPLAMLVMGRDHKLYYEAYNDASDLNQDGEIDVGYKPDLTQDNQPLNYFGYFDSYKCYSYSSGVFTPISVTTNKKCSGSWSGDFLNYLTTSRVDALRRVLYGGYRSTDSTTATVLERARIPQDAHSWGKEYKSIAFDGYDIREYTPLSLPLPNTRHLFANTTLQNDTTQTPLLRVLTNSAYRIWEWVAIERPVAGDRCLHGGSGPNCETSGSTTWEIVPSSFLTLTQTVYKITTRDSSTGTSNPSSSSEFDSLVLTNAITANLCGLQLASTINGSGNPFNGVNGCSNENYLTIFTGQINIPTDGTYTFAVDGDDAVDLQIDGAIVASWYGGHARCNCNTYSGSIFLTAGLHTIRFRHEEATGDDYYYLRWQRTVPASVRTDYTVRVEACVSGLLEPECKGYPESGPTVYKPTGLLHDYGETDRMAFGLLTGSFKKHMSGGVLRKNISSFKNEINANTGQFIVPASAGSIVDTISKIRVVGFQGAYAYNDGGCAVPMVTAMQEGRCAMWGNPIAEMMYEGLRYFGGKSGPTSAYAVSSATDEFSSFVTADKLNLPLPNWTDPYRSEANGGYPYCSKPFELVIADAPSFDTDQLPGVDTNFGSGISSDIGSLNVASIGQLIWNNEDGPGTKNIFIGQSGSVYDTAPTPKSVNSFGNIRGLAPEEPTRQGGYYAASVAYFGKTTGVRQINTGSTNHDVKTDTFGVTLSSPLPTIDIPMANDKTITVVPFAKSVGGNGISATKGQFQPTNTIVDFFVETIANTGAGNVDASVNGGRPYIKFRINYEDSEYGSDHDMDAIVTYTFTVDASNQLIINLSSDYAAGSVIQHMGYVISGTTADGVYLEVRDVDTSTGSDPDYFLDTPPTFIGIPPAPDSGTGTWDDNVALPLTATRTFSPSTAATAITAAFIKHDPLWYAAKWGGFIDANADDLPDQTSEWDRDNNGNPDSYFLVTNAGKLKEQLSQSFEEIVRRTSSAAAVAVNSSSLIAGGRLYQARFNSGDWTGELRALSINPNTGATEQEVWLAQDQLSAQNFNTGRQILTIKPSTSGGIPFRWPTTIPSSGETNASSIDQAQIAALNGSDAEGEARLDFLRGDASNEDPQGNLYRKRTIGTNRNVLGDIVDSNPFYVGPPSAGYPFGDYRQFSIDKQSRSPMVYIGANDGMLHGFNAETGAEVFAYVPSAVFSKLNALTELTYVNQHQFYVDASPTVLDVQFSDESWHTVLVSGLRGGGASYFALDVTDPTTLTETNAANVVLWEFTDADLGLTFNQPSLVRRKDSDANADNNPWVAVFGNGYNSNNASKTPATTAVLYVVNVQNGQLIRKIDLGEGQGLSTPSVVDVDADDIADFVYAGDLEGNLWRFDIRSADPNSWTYAKLTTALDANGNPQPITSAPQVTRQLVSATDPNTSLMVLFGTGRYLGVTDVTNTDQQTFYGIWDDVGGSACPANSTTACFTRADLQAQIYCPGNPVDPTCQLQVDASTTVTSTGSVSSGGNSYRITSARCVEYGATGAKLCGDPARAQQRGWYLDLKLAGERVVGDPLIIGSRVAFTSILPDPDPCAFGGNSWLNILSAVDGQRLPATFVAGSSTPGQPATSVTEASTGFAPSSVAITGIASAPNVMRAPDQQRSILYVSTSEGSVENYAIVDTEIGRQSWRQLEFQ